MSVTENFATWAAETPDIRDTSALNKARDAFLDTIGVMIAGAPDEGAQSVWRAVSNWGEGASSVVGHSKRLSAPWAALANGTAGHALDFDDSFSPLSGHASAVLVPALLALGEEKGASGHALLDAYLVGLEIQARVGQGVNVEHYKRGWHATATVATIGAAAGCGRLLGLDAAKMRNAISIAVSMAAGTKKQFGSMAKPMHAGLAAKNAIMAAGIAEAGLEANPETLDGKWSFRDLYAGDDSPGYEKAVASLGNPLAIEEFGLSPKSYPCCASTHRSLDGLLALKAEHDLKADDVVAIRTVVPPIAVNNLRFSDPQSEMEKRFSMHYCLSTAMTHGEVVVNDFRPGAEIPDEVKAFMPKVEMLAHEGADTVPPTPTTIDIALRDGRTLSKVIDTTRGQKALPLVDDDYARKFLGCAAVALDSATASRLHEQLMSFDTLASIGDALAPLRAEPAAAAAAE